MPDVELDLQVAINNENLYVPEKKQLADWIHEALIKAGYNKSEVAVSLRIVDEAEITELNRNYRKIDKPTNVL